MPILMTPPSELPEPPAPLELEPLSPPQAARLSAIASVSRTANILFILFNPPIFCWGRLLHPSLMLYFTWFFHFLQGQLFTERNLKISGFPKICPFIRAYLSPSGRLPPFQQKNKRQIVRQWRTAVLAILPKESGKSDRFYGGTANFLRQPREKGADAPPKAAARPDFCHCPAGGSA